MSNTISFTGVQIKKVVSAIDPKTGLVVVSLILAAAWTRAIRDTMGWENIADEIESARLSGELVASEMTLVPDAKELEADGFSTRIQSIGKFHAAKIADGDSRPLELRFTVTSVDNDVEALAGAYLRTVGLGEGNMTAKFTKQLAFGEEAQAVEA